jgi:hypothetical protein
MVSRPALHKDGGQALDLLTIALKTDSNKPVAWVPLALHPGRLVNFSFGAMDRKGYVC